MPELPNDPLAFLRAGRSTRKADKCQYAVVRDSLPDNVRDALLAVEDDRAVSSVRMLELIDLHAPRSVGTTTIRKHRAGCPTCQETA